MDKHVLSGRKINWDFTGLLRLSCWKIMRKLYSTRMDLHLRLQGLAFNSLILGKFKNHVTWFKRWQLQYYHLLTFFVSSLTNQIKGFTIAPLIWADGLSVYTTFLWQNYNSINGLFQLSIKERVFTRLLWHCWDLYALNL